MTFLAMRCAVGALILTSAAVASAQSLADVARREEERRKTIRTAGKVYTNDELSPEPASTGTRSPAPPASTAPPAAPPAAPTTPSTDAPGTPKPDAAAAGEVPKTEAEWRKRMAAERDALSRAQIFAEALQSRINVLSADFVNRDDPVQRDAVAADRQKALAELDRVKQEILQHQKAITTIQDQARRAGVPAGWVR